MLSFNLLGLKGRLGNQMFQYATLLSMARKLGTDHCIPPSRAEKLWEEHQLLEVFELPALKHVGRQKDVPPVVERSFTFDAEFYENCPPEADLVGFFQTEKYFTSAAKEVRREFTFKPEVENYCRKLMTRFPQTPVSLHVRRGDYLELAEKHPPCSIDYYARALASFDPAVPVMVFSDDPQWCREQELFRAPRFAFITGHPNQYDLCMMTMCAHHIIANSSFSWWGAWLGRNRDKKVIAPQRWFGETKVDRVSNKDTQDLVPARWVRL